MTIITLLSLLAAQASMGLLLLCIGRDFSHAVVVKSKQEARRPFERLQTKHALQVSGTLLFLLVCLATAIDPSI